MNPDLWPTASPLSPVDELKILARSLDGVAYREAVFDRPFSEVWAVVGDVERSVPAFDRLVTSVTITERTADGRPSRIRVGPLRMPLAIELRDGWCLMVSPLYTVGMAAEPLPNGQTRYAHVEGTPPIGGRHWRQVVRSVGRVLARRHAGHVRHDVDGIRRLLEKESAGGRRLPA